MQITPTQSADLPAIALLLDHRFGPARRNRTAYRLRDGIDADPELSFVASDGDRLLGSVQCWPIAVRGIAGAMAPLTLLGPLVVDAGHEGRGIATALMARALAVADRLARPPLLLIGDAAFYARFGFSADATQGWRLPGPFDPARLLLRGAADPLPRLGWVGPVRRLAA